MSPLISARSSASGWVRRDDEPVEPGIGETLGSRRFVRVQKSCDPIHGLQQGQLP